MSVEPFKRLVRLTARAFYDDYTPKSDTQPKNGRSDNKGMAIVVIDALTRRQWVKEEDLAKALKLHLKQLRRTLQFFKDEKLIAMEHRKESAKAAKIYNAAAAAASDGQRSFREGEDKMKMQTYSYCCLDYAQVYDVVRYRIHRMRKHLKDQLDNRNTIQKYLCPQCGRRYSAFDALQLCQNDEYFQCEKCNAELVPESDKLADADDKVKRPQHEKLKDMLQKMEEQLKPLTLQLARIKDIPAPELLNLQAWEARLSVVAQKNDSTQSSQSQGFTGTPMPFIGETKVEVALFGVESKEEGTAADVKTSAMKVLPPWMIKQGMNLTREQRGEAKVELNMDHGSTAADDKKQIVEKEDEKSIQGEYIKAYYDAFLKRQEQEAASKGMQQIHDGNEASTSGPVVGTSEETSGRQVGMKSKRENDEDNEVEWDEDHLNGNTNQTFEPASLTIQADASDDEDIDWEEG